MLALLALGCQRPSAPAASEAEVEPLATGSVPSSRGGAELVGQPASPFAEDLVWFDGEARSLASMRGKVLLVRFWTDTCPFCEASAPGLSALHERYADQGLEVVGIFHPKPRGSSVDLDAVAARAKELGMEFSIASDARWDTLERWWLASGEGERKATSVSFLIDAEGRIRWVHPGPEFHPDGPADHEQCRADYDDAVSAIESLLAERASAS